MKRVILATLFCSIGFGAIAAEKTVEIRAVSVEKAGALLGQVVITETPYGLLFTPALNELTPGLHGFHLHENPDCGTTKQDDNVVPAGAAGGHFDPQKTGKHLGPYQAKGHLGDLPALYVDADGKATMAVLAPRIHTLAEIENRALMIHMGGDNHSDEPAPLGGGGARVACGVIQ